MTVALPASTVRRSGEPADLSSSDAISITRRRVDTVLISIGAVLAMVFFIASGLLTWGSRFANDYVGDELRAQHITFGDAPGLTAEGRDDLAKYGGRSVTNGTLAQAYAGYIAGHLRSVAGGKTYADLGAPERKAKAEIAAATERGATSAEVSALQANADTISNQRNTLFKGETLRGLLLTTYAWSTIGRIAGIAASAAFLAAVVMSVLSLLGVRHLRTLVTR